MSLKAEAIQTEELIRTLLKWERDLTIAELNGGKGTQEYELGLIAYQKLSTDILGNVREDRGGK